MCLRKYIKTWQKIKNDVYEDAVLWRKLNQNTQGRFICYRKYYLKKKVKRQHFKTIHFSNCKSYGIALFLTNKNVNYTSFTREK